MTHVAVLGLGTMGLATAQRLIDRGHQVSGADPDSRAAGAATAAGVEVIADPAAPAAIEGIEEIVVAVATGDQAVAVAGEWAAALPAGPIRLVVLSTVGPTALAKLAEIARTQGWSLLDAPVSGGEPAAREGTLAAMVAGGQDVIDASVFLRDVADRVVRVGAEPGDAQVAKMAHQLVLCANVAAIRAAVTLAAGAGVPEGAVVGAVQAGTARSQVADSWDVFTGILARAPGDRRRSILEKDLALVLAELGSDPSGLLAAVVTSFRAIPTAAS